MSNDTRLQEAVRLLRVWQSDCWERHADTYCNGCSARDELLASLDAPATTTEAVTALERNVKPHWMLCGLNDVDSYRAGQRVECTCGVNPGEAWQAGRQVSAQQASECAPS